MNKSTPIAQLPSNNMQNSNFVNEQQRQFIAQAQQAISNSNIPQNTQISSDIVMNDDDIVVQDILNQINASSNNNEQTDLSQLANQQLLLQQLAAQTASVQQQNMTQNNKNILPPTIPPNMFQQNLYNSQNNNPFENLLNQSTNTQNSFLELFADDIKLAGLVFISTIIAHFIPLHSIISKYIVLDKIPYHEIILRAIMVTLLVVIIKKISKI